MPQDPTRERVAYLPPRAARARKLILRSQLGLPWMLTAALFGVVILAAGAVLLVKGGRPGAPWVRLAPVTRFGDGAVTQTAGPSGRVVVVDRRDGSLHAFLLAPGPCPVVGAGSGFARPCAGQTWDRAGRPSATPGHPAPAPMRPVPVQIARGDLYVNLERRSGIGAAPPSAREQEAAPARTAGLAKRRYLTAALRGPWWLRLGAVTSPTRPRGRPGAG